MFADWFVPGYKAGGPIRSCLHFVQQMKEKYSIYVITTDRDLHASSPYENVVLHQWTSFDEDVQIYYAAPDQLSWKNILQQVKKTAPDFIYLNSMYSRYFTIYPLLMHRLGYFHAKLVLAPRGMLKQSALQFHRAKKRIFLNVLKWMGIPRRVHFHATDQTELHDICRQFGKQTVATLAANFAAQISQHPKSLAKQPGALKIIFVGRVHPIKNLHYLLQLLPAVEGNIELTVVGSEEDASYTEQCKSMVQQLPARIRVQFTGEIPNHQLPPLIHHHHIFALPTQGENFGHAIFEALAAARPVLISDQTPWRNLRSAKAGWDLPLAEQQAFINALQQAVELNQKEYEEWSKGAWNFVRRFSEQSDLKQLYYSIFS